MTGTMKKQAQKADLQTLTRAGLAVPEYDAQELLAVGLLVFQRHDEVPDAAARAVIVHVLLDKCKQGSAKSKERPFNSV